MKKRCIECAKHRVLTYKNFAEGLLCKEWSTNISELKDLDAKVEVDDEDDLDYCPTFEAMEE